MNSKEIIKYLKNSIDEKGNYCYSLPIETTRKTIKCIEEKDKEIERLNNIINELEKYLWEERYNHQGEYAFTSKNKLEDIYTMILNKLDELKGSDKE